MSMCSRGWAYVVKAGTIILLCNTVVQIMQTFTWSLQFIDYAAIEESLAGAPEETITAAIEAAANTSILASIATPFAYVLIPIIGIAAWQLAAAAITGFIAKENVVGTIAICYGITNFIDVEELALKGGGYAGEFLAITNVAALAYLMFNLFTPPCFAAIGAMNSEIKSKKWLWGGIGLQFATGYTIAFLVYQIGTLITTGTLGAGFIPGLIVVAAIVAYISYLIVRANRELKQEYALNGSKKEYSVK